MSIPYAVSKAVNDMLAKKFEGKLFVNFSLFQICGKSYSIHKDHYTVRDGKVYMVNDGKEYYTEDTLISIESECKRIGIYDPNKVYKRVIKSYTYAEFKKLHRL